jgi:phosphatidylglycerophosphate synthase
MEKERNAIRKYSTKELRAVCQGSAPNPARESKIGRSSRFFSIYFTRTFISLGVSPNWLNVLGVFVFFTGIFLFIPNIYELNFVAALLVYISIIIDCCDGEVARFKKMDGVLGSMYNEPISHDVMYGLMFLPIGVGLFLSGYSPFFMLLGGLAGISKLLYRGLELRFWNIVHDKKDRSEIIKMKEGYSIKHVAVRFVYWVNKNLFSSTGVFLGMLVFLPFNRLDLYLLFYSFGFFGLWLLLFSKQLYTIKRDNIK